MEAGGGPSFKAVLVETRVLKRVAKVVVYDDGAYRTHRHTKYGEGWCG